MLTFPDGRIAFKDWSTLRIYDPVLETLTSHYIGNDTWGEDYQIANNTHIYVKYNTKLTKVDITDLNAITYETIVNTGNLNLQTFHIADGGNTIYYAVRNDFQNDSNTIYKKEGNESAEIIYVGNESYMVKYLK